MLNKQKTMADKIYNVLQQDIIKSIKICRIIKNISVEEIAEVISITPRAYYYLEQGKTVLTFNHLVKICNFLCCSIEELIHVQEVVLKK